MNNQIIITELDYVRLSKLILAERNVKTNEVRNLAFLSEEINRAEKVDSRVIAPDFVTMNSTVEIIDEDTKKSMTIKLVYPNESDFRNGRISILSPLGAALLGYKTGSVIAFNVPKGVKKMKIKSIIYQPEAQGEYTV